MKLWLLVIPAVLIGIFLTVFYGARDGADVHTAAAEATVSSRRVPVIVELFTSEGCSSCPPADRVLRELDETQPVPGAEIVAVSEHVDYWNYIGWTDPYSSELYSARQQSYASAFGQDGVYTPQMVVDGRIEFNGSNMTRARDAISQAARRPKADIRLARKSATADQNPRLVVLDVNIDKVPAVEAGDFAEVLLAITENHLSSQVSRGENSGRRLTHTAVAREIRSLGRIDGASGGFSAAARIFLADGWKAGDMKALVFVQERARRRILGAAAIRLDE